MESSLEAVSNLSSTFLEQLNARTTRVAYHPERAHLTWAKNVLFVFAGIALIISNWPTVAAVLRYRQLSVRREYVLFAGLAGSDLVSGVATFLSGVYRIGLTLWGRQNYLITRWSCVFRTLPLMLFSTVLPPSLALLLSLDRMYALLCPLVYFKSSQRHSRSTVLIIYWVAILCTVFGLLQLFTSRHIPEVPPSCVVSAVVREWYFYVLYIYRFLAGLISVLVCFVLAFFHGKLRALRRQQLEGNGGCVDSLQLSNFKRQQYHVYKTVGICCIFTLIFQVVPTALVIVNFYEGGDTTVFEPYAWLASCVNALANVVVFARRHRDLRGGMRRVVDGACLRPCYWCLVGQFTPPGSPTVPAVNSL